MNEEKLKKAEHLLAEIGEIDDELLCQAVSYRKKRRVNSKAAAIAATLTLVFCLTVAVSLSIRDVQNSSDDVMNDIALESLFTSLDRTDGFSYVSDSESLPYFDGEAHIVWQYSSGKGYYLSGGISGDRLASLTGDLGRGEAVGESSPILDVKVWILLGDGRVLSPYLELSSGNISNEVFDYEAEIVPSDSLVQKIQSVLS